MIHVVQVNKLYWRYKYITLFAYVVFFLLIINIGPPVLCNDLIIPRKIPIALRYVCVYYCTITP